MMKANTQTVYLTREPSIFVDLRFIARDPAITVLERKSATIVAIINTKAATTTLGKNPSTSSFKKNLQYNPNQLG